MSNQGLFVGVPALALALAAKMAQHSLTSAARRAIAKCWSSGVTIIPLCLLCVVCALGYCLLHHSDLRKALTA
jgi:hypothetical protein